MLWWKVHVPKSKSKSRFRLKLIPTYWILRTWYSSLAVLSFALIRILDVSSSWDLSSVILGIKVPKGAQTCDIRGKKLWTVSSPKRTGRDSRTEVYFPKRNIKFCTQVSAEDWRKFAMQTWADYSDNNRNWCSLWHRIDIQSPEHPQMFYIVVIRREWLQDGKFAPESRSLMIVVVFAEGLTSNHRFRGDMDWFCRESQTYKSQSERPDTNWSRLTQYFVRDMAPLLCIFFPWSMNLIS